MSSIQIRRQISALLLLSVIVVTGWAELATMAARLYLMEATQGATTCGVTHSSGCHASAMSTSCCGESCRLGAACRCADRAPGPRQPGMFLTVPDCHPAQGSMSAIPPASISHQFLEPPRARGAHGPAASQRAPIIASTAALPRHLAAEPLTPPPQRIVLPG